MERLRIAGTDPQSAIIVTREYAGHEALYTETQTFLDTQEAESVYSRKKSNELMAHGLSPLGGAIAGIGLRIIADTNFNTLEDYYQKPEFFLGLTLVGVGAMMVKRALDAVDKYDNAKIYLDKVKNWRNSFKTKKEKTVFGEIEPVERLIQAKSDQPPKVSVEKKRRIRTKSTSTKKSSEAKPRRRTSKISVPKVGSVSKETKEDIGRQNLLRCFMTEKNNRELKELGIIPYHECLENMCWVCRKYDPIFI